MQAPAPTMLVTVGQGQVLDPKEKVWLTQECPKILWEALILQMARGEDEPVVTCLLSCIDGTNLRSVQGAHQTWGTLPRDACDPGGRSYSGPG